MELIESLSKIIAGLERQAEKLERIEDNIVVVEATVRDLVMT